MLKILLKKFFRSVFWHDGGRFLSPRLRTGILSLAPTGRLKVLRLFFAPHFSEKFQFSHFGPSPSSKTCFVTNLYAFIPKTFTSCRESATFYLFVFQENSRKRHLKMHFGCCIFADEMFIGMSWRKNYFGIIIVFYLHVLHGTGITVACIL